MSDLLSNINSLIKQSGGRARLAHAIIQESPGWFDMHTKQFIKRRAGQADRYVKRRVRSNGWSDEDLEYLIKSYGTMPVTRLARALGRTQKATCKKFYQVAGTERIAMLPKLTRGQKYRRV